ncbi:hypothetical protein L0F63_004664, partial [Massospora cicadina]
WVFNRNPVAVYHAKSAFDKRNAEFAESQRGRSQPDTLPREGGLSQDPDFPVATEKIDKLGGQLDSSDRALFEGFVMLTLGVVLNYIGQGNRTAGDIFSLLILFSVFFVACFHWSGYSFVAHALWLVAHL